MDGRQNERVHMSMFEVQVMKCTDLVGSSSNTCRENLSQCHLHLFVCSNKEYQNQVLNGHSLLQESLFYNKTENQSLGESPLVQNQLCFRVY